jgi:hypothetical protein
VAIPTTLPGMQVDVQREVVYKTHIAESMSGIEYRSQWQIYPRYRFKVSIIGRTEAAGELAALDAAATGVNGELTPFSFVDPFDGYTRTCRLEGNARFSQYRIRGWWKAEYTLITVL